MQTAICIQNIPMQAAIWRVQQIPIQVALWMQQTLMPTFILVQQIPTEVAFWIQKLKNPDPNAFQPGTSIKKSDTPQK